MVRAVGSMVLVLGFMFVAVKWNRKNGIMSGFGCLCCTVSLFFHTLSHDQGHFVFLRHTYLITALLFLGGMHVQFFPSNMYIKTGKSNHGNISDVVAICCIALTIQFIFFTSSVFGGVEISGNGVILSGIVSKSASSSWSSSSETSIVSSFLAKCCGSLLFVVSMMFSAVKWNRANGKLGGIGCFLAIANLFAFGDALNINDVLEGKINSLHFVALALLVGGTHVFFFPSNKVPKRVDKTK